MSRKNIPLTDDSFWNDGGDKAPVPSITGGVRNTPSSTTGKTVVGNSIKTTSSSSASVSSSSSSSVWGSTKTNPTNTKPFPTSVHPPKASPTQSRPTGTSSISGNHHSHVNTGTTTVVPPTKGNHDDDEGYTNRAYDEDDEYYADSDLLDQHYDSVAKVVGEDDFTEDDIVDALRATNYDPHKAIAYLLENDNVDEDDEEIQQLRKKTTVAIQQTNKGLSTPNRSSSSTTASTKTTTSIPSTRTPGTFNPPQGSTPNTLAITTPTLLQRSSSISSVVNNGGSTPKPSSSSSSSFSSSSSTLPLPPVPDELTQRFTEDKPRMAIVVVGHVDAGKSTLMGHLLADIGTVNARTIAKYAKDAKAIGKGSFAYAWVLDASDTERSRGVTVDVGINYFETPRAHFTLLDAPGHRDFVPNMITGVAQADVAILVVDASRGEFEAGFGPGGQTREAAALTRNFGITQLIVAVNKMDANHIEWNEERFTFIVNTLLPYLVSVGYRKENVLFIPVSGLSGVNLVKSPQEWLDNLLTKTNNNSNSNVHTEDDNDVNDNYSNEDDDHPSRYVGNYHENADIADMANDLGFTSSSSSLPKISSTTSLRTVSTTSSIDNDATIAPERVTVKELRTLLSWYNGEKSLTLYQALDTLKPPVRILDKPLRLAISDIYRHQTQGLTIAGRIESGWIGLQTKLCFIPGSEQGTVKSITINGFPVPYAGAGDNVDVGIGGIEEAVLVPGQIACWPTHPIRAITKLKAQIAILPGLELPLVAGQQFTFHSHTIEEPCNLTRLLRTLDREGHTKDIKPRFISTSGTVAVVRIRLTRPVPLDVFSDQKRLGRFMLRYSGRTVAAGMILKITG